MSDRTPVELGRPGQALVLEREADGVGRSLGGGRGVVRAHVGAPGVAGRLRDREGVPLHLEDGDHDVQERDEEQHAAEHELDDRRPPLPPPHPPPGRPAPHLPAPELPALDLPELGLRRPTHAVRDPTTRVPTAQGPFGWTRTAGTHRARDHSARGAAAQERPWRDRALPGPGVGRPVAY
ncbi:hypothetical protein FL583_22800 [Cryptosporangium phraense]|uniref:Uncharacterized protein n=1 Tax=Cryptosporangium phraense TaxID=2593070 RepID=A0A545ANI7_9ACTN|nr:hypothetical protein FL583_22800 [Cryptosporangium phraense]